MALWILFPNKVLHCYHTFLWFIVWAMKWVLVVKRIRLLQSAKYGQKPKKYLISPMNMKCNFCHLYFLFIWLLYYPTKNKHCKVEKEENSGFQKYFHPECKTVFRFLKLALYRYLFVAMGVAPLPFKMRHTSRRDKPWQLHV